MSSRILFWSTLLGYVTVWRFCNERVTLLLGHVELAMLLLERGANIEEVNDEGYTPLMEAAREGHEEMVALLLSQGADINAQTEETQETALTLACCGGFLEVADFLIKAGADLELGASTPLMEAAQEGHLDLVKYLLENGALVNAQTGTGDTALTYACENGHTDVADLLLQYNAELVRLAVTTSLYYKPIRNFILSQNIFISSSVVICFKSSISIKK